MHRNLLLLVEQTPSARYAQEIACAIAAHGNCTVTGMQISEAYWEHRTHTRDLSLAGSLANAIKQRTGEPACDDTSELLARHKVCDHEVDVSGPRYALLSREAERNDLTLLGREGNFEELSSSAREVISLMLQYRPRPMVITPPQRSTGDEVLVTYDGGPRASRAIQLFILLGLAVGKKLHVLCIDRQKKAAQEKIDSISAFLKQHELQATTSIIQSREMPIEVLMHKIDELQPSMVVAGAVGTRGWRQTMFGSAGDYLIRHCPVPLFTSP